MKHSLLGIASIAVWAMGARAHALDRVRFIVVDPVTRAPIAGARVTVEELNGAHRQMRLSAGWFEAKPTAALDLRSWEVSPSFAPGKLPGVRGAGKGARAPSDAVSIVIPLDTPITLQEQGPPTKDIFIKVTASRIVVRPNETSGASTRDKNEISKFVNTAGGDTKKLTQGQSGVASDSAGQQHIRGEHTEITYVVDGVPLPDTLSGRQGSVVVPSTIERLEIITGGFAPEFGGQTAAVLNIATLPSAKAFETEGTLQTGTFNTINGDFTAVGPFRRGSFVVNVGATHTENAIEPLQPDDQTAHNRAEDLNLFGKLRYGFGPRDSLTVSLSKNPGKLQNANRTRLPNSFSDVGEGYGFLGLRNADGSRPDVGPENAGTMGSENILLPTQEDARQDINLKEVSEFLTLNWQHQFSDTTFGQLSLTALHSGQDVSNNSPAVDLLHLPVDNSIEYNPTVTRNVHHFQFTGSIGGKADAHSWKGGFVYDIQSGHETYQLTPASRLALNQLAALDPTLAPEGSFQTDQNGNPVLDVNGNQVFIPSGTTTPVLSVNRTGSYGAAYLQDTWKASKRLTVNYGLRADWFHGSQDLGQPEVNSFLLSPRLNFSYAVDRKTALRWSYNKLFNTPPLAQGAIVGAPIQPAIVDQYDLSVERATGAGQSLKLAYYAKQIKNQVDVGLLIPGSQIGLFSGVNLERGGVHGVELSYEVSDKSGWDAYLNYSYSKAAPNGLDSTGEPVDDFNDHDQRHTIGAGVAYSWKNGASVAGVISYGSGLASSIVGDGARTARFDVDLRYSSGDGLFGGHGGLGIDVENVFDSRRVINFQSAFSGTRFQQGRRVLVSAFYKF